MNRAFPISDNYGNILGLALTVGVVSALAPKVRKELRRKKRKGYSLEKEVFRI